MKKRYKIQLKIGVDIDNVICDSGRFYIERFNKFFKRSVASDKITDINYIENDKEIGYTRGREFVNLSLHDEKFQLSIPPVFRSFEILNSLVRLGHSIHFITARPVTTREITQRWLKKHGFIFSGSTLDLIDPLIFETDCEFKNSIIGRHGVGVLIEDNLEIANFVSVPVILIDMPWNRGKTKKNITRVKDWQEIQKRIKLLEKEKL